MPVFGPHPVTVPGAIDGWFTLLERFGTKSFAEVAATALHYAEEGFLATRRGAWFFMRSAEMYRLLGLPDFGDFYGDVHAGTRIHQPELARTIRTLAADGPDAYYRGPIGAAIAARIERAGGFMTAEDVAAHAGAWVEPLHADFRGVDVLEMPPPTQGMAALEALRILDGCDLGADGPDRQHLLIEAVKLALADRNAHLGDPAAMPIAPETILADDWIKTRRDAIDPACAQPFPLRPGPDGGTIYMCTADRDGLMVSLIQSNFSGAGSGCASTSGASTCTTEAPRSSSTTSTRTASGPARCRCTRSFPRWRCATANPGWSSAPRVGTVRRRRTRSCSCA